MSEEIKMPNPPEPVDEPEKKNRTVLWIVLAIVAVILLCLCVVVVAAVILFSVAADNSWSLNQIPVLLSLM